MIGHNNLKILKSPIKACIYIFAAFSATLVVDYLIVEGALPTFSQLLELNRHISPLSFDILLIAFNAVILLAAGELISKASNRKILCSLIFTVALFIFYFGADINLESNHLYVSRVMIYYVFPEPELPDIKITDENDIESIEKFMDAINPWPYLTAWFANFAFIFVCVWSGTFLSKYLLKPKAQSALRYLTITLWTIALLTTFVNYALMIKNGLIPFHAIAFHMFAVISLARIAILSLNISIQYAPFKIVRNQQV